MSDDSEDRTASLMTPAKLAQLKVRPKPAASPTAWLDQMAADAGSGHVRRLVDLRKQLQGQLGEPGYEPIASALQALHGALSKLDFSLVQPKGWLARATGKGKEATAEFMTQYHRVGKAGEDLVDELRALQKKHQVQVAAVERTLAEFEVEIKALEKIMEQGTRWLQDMRNQLKERQAAEADAAQQRQIQEDSARCEVLVARLKALRAADSASQKVVDRTRALATSRVSVTDSLQQVVAAEWAAWQRDAAPIAQEVTATGASTRSAGDLGPAQEELQAALKQGGKDCRALEAQEQSLGEKLTAMHDALQAAA